MDPVHGYLLNQEWKKDEKMKRKQELLKLAKDSFVAKDVSRKIGGVLIYNQVVEELLKEVILCSASCIKVQIHPNVFTPDINFEKSTFGYLIKLFKQYAIYNNGRDNLLTHLKILNEERNVIVHELFELNFEELEVKLDHYSQVVVDVITKLMSYYQEICEELNAISERIDFEVVNETY